MTKVMLTGGAGYIGSVLAPALLERGHEVTVLDRMFFGEDKLPPAQPLLSVVRKDTRDLTVQDLRGHDAVIDLAAISNDPAGDLDPALTWSINHEARVRCARLARDAGVARYVLPSSSSVYGQQEGLLDETSTIRPRTAYAEANAAAEEGVLALASDDFTVTAVRKATVFGASKRMRMDLVLHQMVVKAMRERDIPVLGDGTQWRPFVHIADVADAYALLLEAPHDAISGETFNLGGDHLNLTIRELAETVGGELGVDGYSAYGGLDDRSHRMAFGKIHERLGFVPRRSVLDGVREVADGVRESRIDPDEPRAFTVSWYRQLLDRDDDLSPNHRAS